MMFQLDHQNDTHSFIGNLILVDISLSFCMFNKLVLKAFIDIWDSVKELYITSAELIDMNILLALKYKSLRDTTSLTAYSCSISFFLFYPGAKSAIIDMILH
jgi:hypothetical protein